MVMVVSVKSLLVKSTDGFIVMYVIVLSICVVVWLGGISSIKVGDIVSVVVIKSGLMFIVIMVGVWLDGVCGCGIVLVPSFMMLLLVNGMLSIV